MKKFIYSLVVLFFLSLLLFGAGRIYFHFTDGFSLANIRSNLVHDARWENPKLDEKQLAEIEKILSQSYHYIGKGCQCYTFLSEDGLYVIKFFKFKHLRVSPWLHTFSFLPFVESYERERREKKREQIDRLFSSTYLAYTDLKEETGLILVHLNKDAAIPFKTQIIDKLGWSHEVVLGEFEFVVQRAAIPMYEAFGGWINGGEEEKAKEALRSVKEVIVSRCSKGIADQDHAFMQNIGFIGERAIIIDVGQFERDEALKGQGQCEADFRKRAVTFLPWLQQRNEMLSVYLQGLMSKS